MIFMKSILAGTLLSLSLSANAALIDNDAYTTDTISGLDWLDLNLSANISYKSVLASYPGWRYAENSEVENLFAMMFPTYVDKVIAMHWDSTYDPATSRYSEVLDFQSLFGVTTIYPTASSIGLYKDEDGIIRLMGTQRTTSLTANSTLVYSDEFVQDFTSYVDVNIPEFSTYLVRSAVVVPIPAAAWLFGTGLIGLVGLSKRKR